MSLNSNLPSKEAKYTAERELREFERQVNEKKELLLNKIAAVDAKERELLHMKAELEKK